MPNNKGFAISSVLYLLLVAFLMFLMITLAQFTSSTSVIGKANDDLINGTTFKAVQVKSVIENSSCGTDYEWYQSFDSELGTYKDSNTIVKITSKYGTIYWPKDFPNANVSVIVGDKTLYGGSISINGKITVTASNDKLTFTQDDSESTVTITNICE